MKTEKDIREYHARLSAPDSGISPEFQMLTVEEAGTLLKTIECFLAARVSWPAHVVEAISRGDVEACRADAKARHENWNTLRAEINGEAQMRAAYQRERDEARRDLNADPNSEWVRELRAELAKSRAFADAECAARMEAQAELARTRAELDAAQELLKATQDMLTEALDERDEATAKLLERAGTDASDLEAERDTANERAARLAARVEQLKAALASIRKQGGASVAYVIASNALAKPDDSATVLAARDALRTERDLFSHHCPAAA